MQKYLPKVSRFCYQNGREAIHWDEDFRNRFAIEVENLLSRYKFNKNLQKLIFYLIGIRGKTLYFYKYKILPFLLIRKIFTPPLNIYSGNSNLVKKWFFNFEQK